MISVLRDVKLLIETIQPLFRKWPALRHYFHRTARRHRQAARVRHQLAAVMLRYYRHRFRHRLQPLESTTPIPVLALPEWLPATPVPLSSVQLGWLDSDISDPPLLSPGLADRLRTARVHIVNRPTYRLLHIDQVGGLPHLSFCLSSYNSYIDSCEALNHELAHASAHRWVNYPADKLRRLIPRRLPLRHNCDPFQFTNRSASAGVLTLTVLVKNGKPHIFFLQNRAGRKLAEAPIGYSVIPAGTFQPLSQNNAFHEVEFCLQRNVIREFGEELLGKDELQDLSCALDPDNPFTDPDLKTFVDFLAGGQGQILYLGTVLDCVTLKPELCTVLLLCYDSVIDTWPQFITSWEGGSEIQRWSRSNLITWQKRPDLLPGSKACIALSLNHLQSIEHMATGIHS